MSLFGKLPKPFLEKNGIEKKNDSKKLWRGNKLQHFEFYGCKKKLSNEFSS